MRKTGLAILFISITCYVLFLYLTNETQISREVMEYYLSHFYEDTGAENAVTAIYLNYRMFDSIFETLMLLVSATAVICFSGRRDK